MLRNATARIASNPPRRHVPLLCGYPLTQSSFNRNAPPCKQHHDLLLVIPKNTKPKPARSAVTNRRDADRRLQRKSDAKALTHGSRETLVPGGDEVFVERTTPVCTRLGAWGVKLRKDSKRKGNYLVNESRHEVRDVNSLSGSEIRRPLTGPIPAPISPLLDITFLLGPIKALWIFYPLSQMT